MILIKALNKWRSEHDGKAPESRPDKDNFKKLISSMSTDISKEENFSEAHKAALKAWTPPKVPDDVSTIIRDEKAAGTIPARETKVDEFWVLATALREFVDNEGKGDLPLSGAIPGIFNLFVSFVYSFVYFMWLFFFLFFFVCCCTFIIID